LPTEHFDKIALVPTCFETFASKASRGGLLLLEQVEGHVPQDSHILCCIALSDTTVIFAKGHVQHPMQSILDIPMCANGRQKVVGIVARQAGDVVARFRLSLSLQSPLRIDLDDGLESCPLLWLVQRLQVLRMSGRPAFTDIDVVVALVDRSAMITVCKAYGFSILKQGLGILVQTTLVALDCQNVVRALFDSPTPYRQL